MRAAHPHHAMSPDLPTSVATRESGRRVNPALLRWTQSMRTGFQQGFSSAGQLRKPPGAWGMDTQVGQDIISIMK